MGFEEGFGVYSMDMEYLLGLTVLNMKENKANGNQHGNWLFINNKGKEQEGIWKNSISMNFSLRPCIILNWDFCMVQMYCQISKWKIQQRVAFLPEYLKNCLSNCIRWWIKIRHIKFSSKVQIWKETVYFHFKF